MGTAKLVTGWMVVAALGMTQISLPARKDEMESFDFRGEWFSMILIGIVALAAAGASPRIEAAIPGLGYR